MPLASKQLRERSPCAPEPASLDEFIRGQSWAMHLPPPATGFKSGGEASPGCSTGGRFGGASAHRFRHLDPRAPREYPIVSVRSRGFAQPIPSTSRANHLMDSLPRKPLALLTLLVGGLVGLTLAPTVFGQEPDSDALVRCRTTAIRSASSYTDRWLREMSRAARRFIVCEDRVSRGVAQPARCEASAVEGMQRSTHNLREYEAKVAEALARDCISIPEAVVQDPAEGLGFADCGEGEPADASALFRCLTQRTASPRRDTLRAAFPRACEILGSRSEAMALELCG